MKLQKALSKKAKTFFHHPFPLFFLPQCESTMIEAESLLKSDFFLEGVDESAVWTQFQTAGKGRFADRQWIAAKGESLLVTFVLNPARYRAKPPMMPLLAGLALARYLRSLGLDPQIKWPNDLLIEGKKIAGILCRWISSPSGAPFSREKVLCGIGLNLRQRSFSTAFRREATSVLLAGEKQQKRLRISPQKALQGILFQLAQLEQSPSIEQEAIQEINSLLYKKGEMLDFIEGDPSFQTAIRGRFLGITDQGFLRFVVDREAGGQEIKEFLSGEFL